MAIKGSTPRWALLCSPLAVPEDPDAAFAFLEVTLEAHFPDL